MERPLHLLINNAGLVTGGLARTSEGWELQFATNHLGHFTLSCGLHDALAAGAVDRGEARIVSVGSTAHMRSPVVFDDIQFDRRRYDPQAAYAQSKTANSLFAVEATRRWAPDRIFANAVNPGGVATGLQRNFSQQQKDSLDAAESAGVFSYKTPQQGAATTLVAAASAEFAGTGGHYLDDCREAHTVPDDADLAENAQRQALGPEPRGRTPAVGHLPGSGRRPMSRRSPPIAASFGMYLHRRGGCRGHPPFPGQRPVLTGGGPASG